MFGIDLIVLIKTVGYLGLFGIIFAESGLFFGFFLPGDSLLFTAGVLASQQFLDIYILVPCLFIFALSGDSVGYFFGRKIGPKIFIKEESLFFSKEYVYKANAYYEKYGGKTIIIARFIPIVRTFTPIMAGVGQMNYLKFLKFSIVGNLLWAVGVTLLGYYLGKSIPNIDKYLLPIIAGIIFVSFLPTIIHIAKDPNHRLGILNFIKKVFKMN